MYETTSLKGVRLKSADLSNLEIESTRPKAKGTQHEHGALVDTIVSWGYRVIIPMLLYMYTEAEQ